MLFFAESDIAYRYETGVKARFYGFGSMRSFKNNRAEQSGSLFVRVIQIDTTSNVTVFAQRKQRPFIQKATVNTRIN